MKNEKLSLLALPIALIILFFFEPGKLKEIGIVLPIIGLFLIQIPIFLKIFLPAYEKINHYKIINKIFEYLGKGLIIFIILRLIYKITMKG